MFPTQLNENDILSNFQTKNQPKLMKNEETQKKPEQTDRQNANNINYMDLITGNANPNITQEEKLNNQQLINDLPVSVEHHLIMENPHDIPFSQFQQQNSTLQSNQSNSNSVQNATVQKHPQRIQNSALFQAQNQNHQANANSEIHNKWDPIKYLKQKVKTLDFAFSALSLALFCNIFISYYRAIEPLIAQRQSYEEVIILLAENKAPAIQTFMSCIVYCSCYTAFIILRFGWEFIFETPLVKSHFAILSTMQCEPSPKVQAIAQVFICIANLGFVTNKFEQHVWMSTLLITLIIQSFSQLLFQHFNQFLASLAISNDLKSLVQCLNRYRMMSLFLLAFCASLLSVLLYLFNHASFIVLAMMLYGLLSEVINQIQVLLIIRKTENSFAFYINNNLDCVAEPSFYTKALFQIILSLMQGYFFLVLFYETLVKEELISIRISHYDITYYYLCYFYFWFILRYLAQAFIKIWNVAQCMKQYAVLKNNIDSFFPRVQIQKQQNQTESEICSICHDPLLIARKLQCGHQFHIKCLFNWFQQQNKRTCPNCRFQVPTIANINWNSALSSISNQQALPQPQLQNNNQQNQQMQRLPLFFQIILRILRFFFRFDMLSIQVVAHNVQPNPHQNQINQQSPNLNLNQQHPPQQQPQQQNPLSTQQQSQNQIHQLNNTQQNSL